jgi:hypothetical protein
VRRFLEGSTANDLTDFDELMSSDFIVHLPSGTLNHDRFLQQNKFFEGIYWRTTPRGIDPQISLGFAGHPEEEEPSMSDHSDLVTNDT